MTIGETRAKRARRWVWWGLGSLALIAVLATAWVSVRGLMAKSELDSLSGLSHELNAALDEQDLERATDVVSEIGVHAARATALTSDPVWALAELVPGVGPNLQAARIASAQVDAVIRESATPVLTALASLEAGLSDEGTLDVSALAALEPELQAAKAELDRAAVSLGKIDRSQVIPQLATGIDKLGDAITTIAPGVDALARASIVLPAILGTESPTSILVMAQNNAELRTGGGITGTFVELSADNGRLSIVTQADSAEFVTLDAPPMRVPESTTLLYGGTFGRWVQNTTMTPDFALSASLVQSRWQTLTGRSPDVVVSVDPVVLRALLGAVGPVSMAGSDLTPQNLVQRVLVEPYLTLTQPEQTALFQEAVAAVFERVSSGAFDPMTLVKKLITPIDEGRISMWSADPRVQAAIVGTDLAGPAARHAQAGNSAFAVYFNDTTGGKMDVFLDAAISAGIEQCRGDGLAEVLVEVSLTSSAPANANKLPRSVTGGGAYGVPVGDIGTQVTVAAPPGWFFGGVTRGGAAVPSGDVVDVGFPSSTTTITLSPGQSETAQFRFISPKPNVTEIEVLHTPMLNNPEVTLPPSGCR